MTFTTPVHIAPQRTHTANTRYFLIGSCFSDEIAARMRAYNIEVCANPFGTMYNPLSICACLNRLLSYSPTESDSSESTESDKSGLSGLSGQSGIDNPSVKSLQSSKSACSLFTKADLVYRDGLYHSWLHHGAFSRPTEEEALEAMNTALRVGHDALLAADCIIITLGTAYVYERDGQVVANCHKFPNNEFTRRLLTVDEIVSALSAVIQSLNHSSITNHQSPIARRAINHQSSIITLSPIRHKADGMDGNMVSKATLRLAIESLCRNSPRQSASPLCQAASQPDAANLCHTSYFPSFEIFMDELRDYRWYAADMLHPAPQAVDYVWERFMDTYFPATEQDELRQRHQSFIRSQHRPLHK